MIPERKSGILERMRQTNSKLPTRSARYFVLVVLSALTACSKPSPTDSQETVIVHLDPGSAPEGKLGPELVAPLERELGAAVYSSGFGKLDGNEFATDGSEGSLIIYGSDSEQVFKVIEPILRTSPLGRNARVELRAGGKDSSIREIRVETKTSY